MNKRLSGLTLGQKGALLVVLPVTIQLTLLGFFWCLRNDADRFAFKAGLTRDVSLTVREMIFTDILIITQIDEAIERNLMLGPETRTKLTHLSDQGAFLKKLWTACGPMPDSRFLTDEILSRTSSLVSLVKEESAISRSKELLKSRNRLLDARSPGGDGESASADSSFSAQICKHEHDLLQLLFALSQPDRLPKAVDTAELARNRQLLLGVAVVLSILNVSALLFMGLFFSRGIVTRLRALNENGLRLSRGQLLLPAMGGSDEISQLDDAFHGMATSLTEAARIEQGLFENAHDVLCYVDKSSRFSGMNRAAAKMLGFTPKELIATPVKNVFLDEDRPSAMEHLSKMLARGRGYAPFEARVVRKDGSIVDTLWSTNFVPEEATLFCVVHDISNQKAAQRLRKDVIEMVSHDLNGPLSAISAVHHAIETGKFGALNEKGRRQIRNVRANIDHMLRLINDLLDIEKLEDGTLQLERAQISLSEVIQHSTESVLFLANSKEVELDVACPHYTLFADRHRLVQILVNLLSNAIKFSPKRGKITIAARKTELGIEISVADQGRGIPANMVNLIFDRFQQVKASDATIKGGSGLGLAICKALVVLHGGEIGVESEEGKGSRFYFSIPSDDSR